MTKLLEQAFAAAAHLPEAEQDRLGQDLLAYLEKLRGLRGEIDQGLRSLDEGAGRELDVDAVIALARRKRWSGHRSRNRTFDFCRSGVAAGRWRAGSR